MFKLCKGGGTQIFVFVYFCLLFFLLVGAAEYTGLCFDKFNLTLSYSKILNRTYVLLSSTKLCYAALLLLPEFIIIIEKD